MNEATVVHSESTDSREAGSELGTSLLAGLKGEPDAVVLFASPRFDFPLLLRALDEACRPRLVVGCSSAGEFTSQAPRDSSACALGMRHGWIPASAPMRVTEAEGMRLVSLDAVLASEVFEDYARTSGQAFDRADPFEGFHNCTAAICILPE